MPAWFAIPLIQAGAMLASQFMQGRANKSAAKWEVEQNRVNTDIAYNRQMELLKYQLDYNSPLAQMQRFKDAGLNPNLVYGQGSPGNMQNAPNPPTAAPARRAPVDFSAMANAGMQLAQMKLMESQAGLTEAKTDESIIKQDLIKAQTAVTNANPYLAEGYVSSMVAQLKATAEMKKQEAGFMTEKVGGTIGDTHLIQAQERGRLIMDKQMETLFRKYDMAGQDQKIKAEIVRSKEFQNELSRIQVEWMKNAEITPQHIYQGIFMLLQNLMR